MNLTDEIFKYINSLFNGGGNGRSDVVNLRRKDVAEKFGCVPSQVNYVLRSRFSPERGYLVESQRGGNGYIRIVRLNYPLPEEKLEHYESLVGQGMTPTTFKRILKLLTEQEIITHRERLLVELGLRGLEDLSSGELDLPEYRRTKLQTEWLRRVLRSLILS